MYRLQISAETLVGMLVALLSVFVLLSLFAGAHAFTLHAYAAIRNISEALGVAALVW